MKLQLTFKTPDVLDQLNRQFGYYDLKENFVTDEEQVAIAKEFAQKFLHWSECITLEFDTENPGYVSVQK